MIEKLVSELQYGDIFKFGSNVWDMQHRFHSIRFYSDSKQEWVEQFEYGCRICFWFLSVYDDNGFGGVFKWSDTNKLDQIVYIPQFLLSEQKKTKGKPCIPHGGQRDVFIYKLNDVNISQEYCSGLHY